MNEKGGWTSPLQAKVSASILARLAGDDSGLLILSVIFLLLTGTGLVFEASSPSFLSRTAAVLGLVGLSTLLIRWCFKGSGELAAEGSRISIAVAQQSVTLETTIRDPKEAIRLLRAIIQGRAALPAPHGEVTGNPTQDQSLREYTDSECQQVSARLHEEIEANDRLILRQLDSIETTLPESSSDDDEQPSEESQDRQG